MLAQPTAGVASVRVPDFADHVPALMCRAGEVNLMAGKAKRTTHRSSTGKKLYAVRDAKGRFKDIQSYKRAQGSDIKRKSKAEK